MSELLERAPPGPALLRRQTGIANGSSTFVTQLEIVLLLLNFRQRSKSCVRKTVRGDKILPSHHLSISPSFPLMRTRSY